MQGNKHLLLFDLVQDSPAVIPPAHTGRVTDSLVFGLIKALGAEGIALCKTAQFVQEVVRIDVMGPCLRQRAA